jgi:hypothetical protein
MSLANGCRAALLSLAVLALGTELPAQVQQGAPPPALPSLALGNLPAGARDAILASIDARQGWQFMAAYENANKALALDSTIGLARILRTDLTGAPTTAALNEEYRRGLADAASRGLGEYTYATGLRVTGINSHRYLNLARQILPGDRRIALDQALSFLGDERVDSLRSLVRQHPDWLAPRLQLVNYLAPSNYSAGPQQLYEAVVAAEAAVRVAPTQAASHAALAYALWRIGRHDEAVAHAQASTKIDSRLEYPYRIEAEIYIHDGKPRSVDRARAAYDSAIAATPNIVRRLEDRRHRAFMLFYDGRKAEGQAELAGVAKDYETVAPGTAAVIYSQMAGLAAGTGDSAKVEGYLVEARRVLPQNGNITVQSAQAYALGKQPVAARRELNEFLRRATDTTTTAFNSDRRRLNGMILVAEGKAAEGLAELKKSDLAANPFAEVAMADAYTMLGQKAEAAAVQQSLVSRKQVGNTAISIAIANYRWRKAK